jgi:hypothetical protein
MERLSSFQCGDLSFSSDYDSGNASRVEQVDEHEFALWTACDAEGTPFEKGYRTWFGFAVRGAAKGRQLTFYIHNMNAQGKLIRQGMCPSVRVLPSRPTWTRIPLQTTYTGCKEEDNFVLRFRHKMDGEPDETTYFAFCFPHGYADNIARLAWLDSVFGLPPATIHPPSATDSALPAAVTPAAPDAAEAAEAVKATGDKATGSLDSGRSSSAGSSSSGAASSSSAGGGSGDGASAATSAWKRAGVAHGVSVGRSSPIEAELKAPPGVYDAALAAAASAADGAASVHCSEIAVAAVQAAASVAPPYRPGGVYYHRELLTRSLEGRRIDLITLSGTNGMLGRTEEPLRQTGLMPEGGSRARSFGAKPVFMLTARVHPGETPASHVFDGFVNFLLREHDPRARALRERFVFKLIPMINPDGVYRGHYRADTRGANLNRCYLACPFETHPSVNAIAALVRHLHAKGVLSFYIDTHGHATKRGCFLFGNALPETERMVDNVLYAKLVGANCRWFDFGGCVFTERNMYGRDKRDGLSKEGSGRVAVYKMTGLTHVYTLECNYNMGRTVTRLQPPHIPKGIDKGALSPPPPPLKSVAPKYTPDSWRDVGKALALAALDMLGVNPCSRLGPPNAGGMAKLRGIVTQWVLTQAKKESKRAAARAARRGDDDDEDDDGEEEDEEEAEPELRGEEEAGLSDREEGIEMDDEDAGGRVTRMQDVVDALLSTSHDAASARDAAAAAAEATFHVAAGAEDEEPSAAAAALGAATLQPSPARLGRTLVRHAGGRSGPIHVPYEEVTKSPPATALNDGRSAPPPKLVAPAPAAYAPASLLATAALAALAAPRTRPPPDLDEADETDYGAIVSAASQGVGTLRLAGTGNELAARAGRYAAFGARPAPSTFALAPSGAAMSSGRAGAAAAGGGSVGSAVIGSAVMGSAAAAVCYSAGFAAGAAAASRMSTQFITDSSRMSTQFLLTGGAVSASGCTSTSALSDTPTPRTGSGGAGPTLQPLSGSRRTGGGFGALHAPPHAARPTALQPLRVGRSGSASRDRERGLQ